ncbi:MAG TPA: efflux RND transporter periplasmic adaptor subunit [Holophaga sp.]|nr:efflux RND transporter periplasmic adaptor subunit [Holophaga sp.]
MNSRILIPLALATGLALSLACGGAGRQVRLQVSGNIETTQVEVSFRIAGKVQDRLVDEGQTVREGQVIAHLDSQDLAQTLAMRQADAAVTQAALAELKAGSRKEEIEASKAALEQAQAELDRLVPDDARIRDLHQKGIVSDRDFDTSRASLQAAQAKVRQAQQQYALVKKGPRAEDIDQGRAKDDQARQALALARTQLDYATLVAPLSGVVLSKNVEPREYVAAGTSVVTVGDLEHVWLRAYIEETDLGRVKVDQKARLTSDTYPGKTYEGRVSFISSEAEFTPKSVQTKKERVKLVYRIKIDVPNPGMELKPGMPADAEIETGAR